MATRSKKDANALVGMDNTATKSCPCVDRGFGMRTEEEPNLCFGVRDCINYGTPLASYPIRDTIPSPTTAIRKRRIATLV